MYCSLQGAALVFSDLGVSLLLTLMIKLEELDRWQVRSSRDEVATKVAGTEVEFVLYRQGWGQGGC